MPMMSRGGLVACLLLAGSVLAASAPAANGEAAPTAPEAANAPPAPLPPEVSLANMISAMNRFLSEEDMRLIYNYLWDSSLAALKGGEAVDLPPDVAFKLQVLMQRIRKEGGYYLEGLARKMEADLARAWRERMTPAPPVPYSLPPAAPYPPPVQSWR